MDFLFEMMTKPEAVGISIVLLAVGFIYNLRQLAAHNRSCAKFRKEVRDQDAEIVRNLATLQRNMEVYDTRLEEQLGAVIAVVKRIESNGSGHTCAARKKTARRKSARKTTRKTSRKSRRK